MSIQSGSASEDLLTKGYDPLVTRRLLALADPYRKEILISLVLMLVNSAGAVAGPYLVKRAIDDGLRASSISALRQAVMLYIFVVLIQWGVIYLRVKIMARAGTSIIYDLRARLFGQLQKFSLSFYNRYSVGRVITRVINDVGVLREFITWAVLAIARDLFAIIGILFAMLAMNWRLTMILLLVLPVMIAATILFRRVARNNYRLVRAAISWVNSVLAENINGVRVVQAFSRQQINYTIFCDEVNANNLRANLRAARIAAIYPAVIEFLGSLATALVIWRGGMAVLGENLGGIDPITPGILVAFVLYIDRFFEPIRDLSRRYDTFQSVMAGGERIFGLLNNPIEVQDADDAAELPGIKGEIVLEHVSFHYSDDPTTVLKDINLHIQPGQTIALVGETGAGKSTLAKLICRFHDPTSGRVLVDGHDLRQVTQASLRRQLGIVLQDPFLFSGTVAENIRFGRLEATDAQIVAVSRAVGAYDFITKLRSGFETSVEEGGIILSVGQRQLISFARALLADPRILILDEATSSVDIQTERLIQSALARLFKNRTAIVIAHRLSTIVKADQIVVIQNGVIVEKGSHTELLDLGGMYSQLYRLGFNEDC